MSLPQPSEPFLDGPRVAVNWYRFLRDIGAVQPATQADINQATTQIATALGSPDGTVPSIPPTQTFTISGYGWVEVNGSPESGHVEVSQRSGLTTDDLPEGTTNLYYTDARVDARMALSGSGHSEILVTGAVGPFALTTNDESDWLYT